MDLPWTTGSPVFTAIIRAWCKYPSVLRARSLRRLKTAAVRKDAMAPRRAIQISPSFDIRLHPNCYPDYPMIPQVTIETVAPRKLAAVRRQVLIGQISSAWRPALDKVWEFLRKNPGLRTDGHNIFLYHHPSNRQLPMNVEFGVEVVRPFVPSGEVDLVETPAGKVASSLHIGPYDQMNKTHDAIHAWAAANGATFAGTSWEIYGDWTDDVSKLETRIEYLLS